LLSGEEKVGSPEEVLEDLSRVREKSSFALVAYDRELVMRTLPGIEQISPILNIVSPALAPWIGRIALAQARSGKSSDSLTLDANYVRRSDAEVHRKGR